MRTKYLGFFGQSSPAIWHSRDSGTAGGTIRMKKIAPKPEVKKAVQRGKYVYKPLVSVVVLCKCGNKYILTRPKQTMCVMCIRSA